jgi:hypothetical protein
MKVEIKGKELIITLPIEEKTSGSGKSTVIATTSGNVSAGVDYKGKPLTIGVNAYIKKD